MSNTPNQNELQPNIAGLLCYLFGWVTGIIFFVITKDKFVRFHALQSIFTFGGLTMISILLSLLLAFSGAWSLYLILNRIMQLITFVLWILLMVKAYQGEMFKLPWVGDVAESNAEK